MSQEEVVVAEQPAPKKTTKRKRSKPKGPQIVTVNGTRYFVCSAGTRRIFPRRVYSEYYPDLSFECLPIMLRYFHEDAHLEPGRYVEVEKEIKERYKEPEVPMSFDLHLLQSNGGSVTWDEFIEEIKYWLVHSQQEHVGQTVKNYEASLRAKRAPPKKKVAKPPKTVIAIEPGTYLFREGAKVNQKKVIKIDTEEEAIKAYASLQRASNRVGGHVVTVTNAPDIICLCVQAPPLNLADVENEEAKKPKPLRENATATFVVHGGNGAEKMLYGPIKGPVLMLVHKKVRVTEK